jgi:integration host factor subunit alpha
MSLTKAGIIQFVTKETGLPKNKASHAVERLLEIMKDTLADGEDVLISGFGKFCVREKSERRGRNPATGEDMILSARRVVAFKCSGKLRERCTGVGCEGGD